MRRLEVMRLGAALVCAVVLAASGCEKRVDVDAHYRTRGRVDKVDGAGADLRVLIHHERIGEFKDRDGKPSPMDSMAMNFALGTGVDAALFKPGVKVAVDFDVRWSNSAPLLITRAEVLPDATELVLGGH